MLPTNIMIMVVTWLEKTIHFCFGLSNFSNVHTMLFVITHGTNAMFNKNICMWITISQSQLQTRKEGLSAIKRYGRLYIHQSMWNRNDVSGKAYKVMKQIYLIKHISSVLTVLEGEWTAFLGQPNCPCIPYVASHIPLHPFLKIFFPSKLLRPHIIPNTMFIFK